MDSLGSRLTSRKWIIALLAIAYAATLAFLGEITYVDAIDRVRDIAIGYLVAEGAIDVAGNLRQ